MVELTEETALNLLDELIRVNANLDTLNEKVDVLADALLQFSLDIRDVRVALPPEQKPAAEPKEHKPMDYEPVVKLKKFKGKDGEDSAYLFIGDPKYDVTTAKGDTPHQVVSQPPPAAAPPTEQPEEPKPSKNRERLLNLAGDIKGLSGTEKKEG